MDLRFYISYSDTSSGGCCDSWILFSRCPKHYIAVIWNLAESEQHLRCEPELLSILLFEAAPSGHRDRL